MILGSDINFLLKIPSVPSNCYLSIALQFQFTSATLKIITNWWLWWEWWKIINFYSDIKRENFVLLLFVKFDPNQKKHSQTSYTRRKHVCEMCVERVRERGIGHKNVTTSSTSRQMWCKMKFFFLSFSHTSKNWMEWVK